MKGEVDFQARLFVKMKNKLGRKAEVVRQLTEILGCSQDSAYRRMRGATGLSLNEAIKVAHHLDISLSEITEENKEKAVFQKNSFIKSLDDYRSYMEKTQEQLQAIKQKPEHLMVYQAKDIPVFYQFAFPELAAFKMYVWLKSVYGIQEVRGKPISLDNIPKDLLHLARQQWIEFSKINTVEMWNDTTILSLLKQLEYYYDAGLLPDRDQVIGIMDQIRDMIQLIFRQSEEGKRVDAHNHQTFNSATYQMYCHEILIMDNHILASLNENHQVYFTPYAGVNYLSTSDGDLTHHMRAYLNGQMSKSSLISDLSEKERNKFFARIFLRIEHLKQSVEKGQQAHVI